MKIETREEIHTGLPVVGYGRSAEANATQAAKARRRRVHELMTENHRDNVKIEIPPVFLKGGAKAGKSVNSRRVLASKKSLTNHLDDNPAAYQKYLSAAAAPSPYPSRKRCAICGYNSQGSCIRCGTEYCSLQCDRVHLETRCGR